MRTFWSILLHLRDVGLGALLAGIMLWFFPNRKDWTESRRARREARVDARVLRAISDFGLWTGSRPMTGAGVPAVRTSEVATETHLEHDVVADSLERLYYQGKVRKEDGTLDDPSPIWHFAPR
jgi:hypothetical protein